MTEQRNPNQRVARSNRARSSSFIIPFDSVPQNLYSILSTEGDEWRLSVLNAIQIILPIPSIARNVLSLPYSEDAQASFTKTLETPIQQLTKGTVFASRYEILEELGRGGMGEVYKVKDKKLDEAMALKLLRSEIEFEKSTFERFRNELKLARKISHMNVCRMFDFHEEEGTPYITMEYVPGEDLKSLMKKKGKLSKEEALDIAKQVCEGLDVAHKLDVVHRDLKPQNSNQHP